MNFSEADVALQRRAFLVGPNASGKSNFLDALRFLRDLCVDGGGLQFAVVKSRGGTAAIRCLAARRDSNVSIEVEIGSELTPSEWKYELSFKSTAPGEPRIVSELAWHNGELRLSRPNDEDGSDPERLRQTAIEQLSFNLAFRPLADFFKSIRYLHVVPQLVRHPVRLVAEEDPFGGDLLERINSTPQRTRLSRLKKLGEALRIAVPQMSDLQLEVDDRGVPHLKAKYKHWRPRGAWQRESQFSDGTLRLLGLIWALQEKGGPLLLEEPELSLNAAVVRLLPQMIHRATRSSGRQAVITTHSAELLGDPGIGLDEVHLLLPSDNGTKIVTGADLDDVRTLVEGGLPLGEAIMPKARPASPEQLLLLDLV
jgi:hypothetical protein